MKKDTIFSLIVICISVIFIAGCTNQSIPTASTQAPTSMTIVTTAAVESTIQSTPIPTTASLLVKTNISSINVTTNSPSTNVPSTISTPAFQTTKESVASDPYVNRFTLTKYRYGISDCIMKQAFPDIANDPDYGIHSAHPKLVGISNEKWNAFYQDYITGKNTGQSTFSVSKCQDVPIMDSTTWDFAYVEALLTPRNARPSDYSIIITLNVNGKGVAQLISNETLTLEQKITIESWIPIKRTEIDSLGNPSLNFNRLTNI